MLTNQFEIWIADLNPKTGTESGKTRPVVIVQTNFLNKIPHPSTIICPITTNVIKDSEILRVHLKKGTADLHQPCDIMIDQVRAIDNAGHITYIHMFGEYGIYSDGKIFALVCDNKLFIKPTEAGRGFIQNPVEAPAYPGAKLSFLIEDQLEDRDWISELVRVTVKELPEPKPKKKKKKKSG